MKKRRNAVNDILCIRKCNEQRNKNKINSNGLLSSERKSLS